MGDAPDESVQVGVSVAARGRRAPEETCGIARAWCLGTEGTSVPSAPVMRQGLGGDCRHGKQQFCTVFL